MACNERGGELLAVELPGRESRRAEPRYRTLSVAAEALFPVLAPKLNESVPYVVVGHSMGAALSRSPSRSALSLSLPSSRSRSRSRSALSLCSLSLLSLAFSLSGRRSQKTATLASRPVSGTWMLFETLKLLMARGVRLPEQVVVSSFPAPSLPAAKRPWRANKGMDDDAFKEECRTWSVNEVASLPPSTSLSLPPSLPPSLLWLTLTTARRWSSLLACGPRARTMRR